MMLVVSRDDGMDRGFPAGETLDVLHGLDLNTYQ